MLYSQIAGKFYYLNVTCDVSISSRGHIKKKKLLTSRICYIQSRKIMLKIN